MFAAKKTGVLNSSHISLPPFKHKMLRDVPAEMMREMKQYALDNGGSVRDVILVAVAQFLASNPRK